jgi:5-methylcytosine-specific restriction endonuclease McrA
MSKVKKEKKKECKFCKSKGDRVTEIEGVMICPICNKQITLIMKQEKGEHNKRYQKKRKLSNKEIDKREQALRNKAIDIYAKLMNNLNQLRDKVSKSSTAVKKEKDYKQFYHNYLSSKAWKEKKRLFRESRYSKGECRICGCKEQLHIHHKTYERVTVERLTDLVELCPICHNNVHKIIKYIRKHKIKDSGITLMNCHMKLKNKGFDEIMKGL